MLSPSFHNSELKDIHATFTKFRKNMERAIFGQYQSFGIRIYVNAHFVPTQFEPWGKYVTSFMSFGSPGSGKTTGAFAGASMMHSEVNAVYGLEDITPSMLIGYPELIKKSDGIFEEIFHPGAINPGRCCNIFDEVSRLNPVCQPALANILADGIIHVGGLTIPCAPKDNPLINTLTANFSTSGGTKTLNEFLRDRIIASSIFITPWSDKDHVRALLNLKSHWDHVKDEGILKPFIEPKDIISAHEAIMNQIGCSKEIEDYMVRMLSDVIANLAHGNWVSQYSPPDKWKEAFRRNANSGIEHSFPDEPLIHQVGGRVPQQYNGLVRADSFLEYGSPEATLESAQQMLKGIMWHRLMYGLNEGGYKILAEVYNNELIPFLGETMDWILSLVPAPKRGK